VDIYGLAVTLYEMLTGEPYLAGGGDYGGPQASLTMSSRSGDVSIGLSERLSEIPDSDLRLLLYRTLESEGQDAELSQFKETLGKHQRSVDMESILPGRPSDLA
jgi:serine/threonine protein kinase